jgi:energy-converting hydrogenase Eha subunit B
MGALLVTTPTIVATVDAAVATAIVVLAGLAVEAPTGAVVAAGVVAFLVIWGVLFSLQRLNLGVLRRTSARFPTPPDEP